MENVFTGSESVSIQKMLVQDARKHKPWCRDTRCAEVVVEAELAKCGAGQVDSEPGTLLKLACTVYTSNHAPLLLAIKPLVPGGVTT